jgi:hypothetical protein
MTGRYAQCNRDGRPLSPGDQAVMDEFRRWLALSRKDQAAIIAECRAWVNLPADERARTPEPAWCTYLGFTVHLKETS